MVLYRLREASVGYILCAVCVVLLGCVTQAWVIYSVQCAWYCVGCVKLAWAALFAACMVLCDTNLRTSVPICTHKYQPAHIHQYHLHT